MYNILHLASSRGMSDSMRRRRPHPTVQPAGASHLTLIPSDPAPAAGAGARRTPEARPPSPRPRPSGT